MLILPVGITMAWLFARKEWPLKSFVETIVLLPLVMPPVSTGLILLKIFGRRSPVGNWLYERGIEIVFNWKGVLIAMAVMSFPLLVRSARTSFAEVNPRLEQIAATLGASPLRIFFVITIPLAYKGIVAGALLAFSRALGEFGATILLAGNIPGRTQTLSLAIFNFVQTGKDSEAYVLLAITVGLAFAFVWCSEWLARAGRRS
jgi:molybdate transport system permease protein